MVNISLICVGKIKENWIIQGCSEYIKRLTSICKIDVIEIKPCRVGSDIYSLIQKALDVEAKSILKHFDFCDYVISMCVEGKKLSSVGLSQTIEKLCYDGKSRIGFVLGSSHGISDIVKSKSDLCLSISDMTFTHQMSRVILLEQLYRAFDIINNGKYHK